MKMPVLILMVAVVMMRQRFSLTRYTLTWYFRHGHMIGLPANENLNDQMHLNSGGASNKNWEGETKKNLNHLNNRLETNIYLYQPHWLQNTFMTECCLFYLFSVQFPIFSTTYLNLTLNPINYCTSSIALATSK